MKKIVLGCAAVLLSLGLLAGCNKEDDIVEPGPEVGGSGTVVYVFGVKSSGTMYYITGDVDSEHTYDGVVTTSLSEAVTIEYTVENNNTYYVSFEKSGTTYWVTTTTSGTYVNMSYSTTKAPIYLHTSGSSEYFGDESGEHFLSYYYSSLYCSSTSYLGTNEAFGIYQEDGTLVAGGKSVSSSSSSGSGDSGNINENPTYTGSDTVPEVGDATEYTLAVGTGTIVKNFKRSDGSDFLVGADKGVEQDELDGQTLTFADVFSIAFVHSESGNSTSSRLWGEGIRMYTGNYFTISTSEGWELSTVSIEYASNTANTEYPVITSGENTLATGSATSSSSTYETVNAGSSEASLSSTTSCTSVTATVTRSDESTNGHLKIKTITVTCATVTDEQP